MPNNPSRVRRKLCAQVVEEARVELALALAAEGVANRVAAEAQSDIDRQIVAAVSLSATDADAEMFGAWLPAARRRAAAASTAAEVAGAETGRCRAVLAAARASVRA